MSFYTQAYDLESVFQLYICQWKRAWLPKTPAGHCEIVPSGSTETRESRQSTNRPSDLAAAQREHGGLSAVSRPRSKSSSAQE